MDTSKINLMVEVLEKLKNYQVKFVKSGNIVSHSNPSETAETTYENLKNSIPTLEKNAFYKILSMLLNRTISDQELISTYDITTLTHDNGSGFNIYKRLEILKMLSLVAEL